MLLRTGSNCQIGRIQMPSVLLHCPLAKRHLLQMQDWTFFQANQILRRTPARHLASQHPQESALSRQKLKNFVRWWSIKDQIKRRICFRCVNFRQRVAAGRSFFFLDIFFASVPTLVKGPTTTPKIMPNTGALAACRLFFVFLCLASVAEATNPTRAQIESYFSYVYPIPTQQEWKSLSDDRKKFLSLFFFLTLVQEIVTLFNNLTFYYPDAPLTPSSRVKSHNYAGTVCDCLHVQLPDCKAFSP